jgi:hypothetical protein
VAFAKPEQVQSGMTGQAKAANVALAGWILVTGRNSQDLDVTSPLSQLCLGLLLFQTRTTATY